MANEIQVDPAKLRKISGDIGSCHTQLRNHLQSSKSQVDSLKGIWTGDAASAYAAGFQSLLDKCSEGLKIIENMVNALYDSADAYERSEKSILDEAAKMPKLPNNTMR